ncbi:hypothetical protein ScPMuIL_006367 [Solemya velum]
MLSMVNMVDCGSSRCVQERRSFKKELQTWSKKVPLVVGLECVASELFGEELVTYLLEPLNCLENDTVKDWEPEENCFYCQSRVKLIYNAIEQLTDEIKNGKSSPDNPVLRYLQDLLPYCPQYYTQNLGRDLLADLNGKPSCLSPSDPGDTEVNIPQPQRAPVELKIPAIRTQPNRLRTSLQNGKKTYTEDELTQAVSDIRSGKLGTRRAAVLYGIPRSTLRNKIFKMDTEKDGINIATIAELEESINDVSVTEDKMRLSDLMQSETFKFLPPLPFTLPLEIKGDSHDSFDDWERKLDQLRRKHNLSQEKEHYETQYKEDLLKLPLLENLIRKMAEERVEMERNASLVKAESKKLANLKKSYSLVTDYSVPKPHVNDTIQSTPTTFSVSLSVPSYRPVKEENVQETPKRTHHQTLYEKYENTKLGETLRDIIIKTISEKVRIWTNTPDSSDCSSESESAVPSGNIHHHNVSSAFSVPSMSPSKKVKRELDFGKKKESEEPHSSLKKTRPKRGQYRKYNSQLLMEAVKAVQRGEMSVHRAGTYFGVPHSTLEYKVKERHLLRQKKIKEQQQKEGSPSSEKKPSNLGVSTGSKTDFKKSENSASSSLKMMSAKQNLNTPTWIPQYVNNIPPFDGSGMGYFNSGFTLSTPASELLRKLQHKVQSKSSNSLNPESTFTFHSPPQNGVSPLGEGFVFLN